MDNNEITTDDNSISVLIESDIQKKEEEETFRSDDLKCRMYKGWTRMTPREISQWLDKYVLVLHARHRHFKFRVVEI